VKKSELSILLLEIPETYYWIGFLMADGHFYDNNRIKLTLSCKDLEHIKKFQRYIKTDNISFYKNSVCVSAMDVKIVPLIKNKFSITSHKTYEPCDITNITNDNLFISLFIGFVDGDGSISNIFKRKDSHILIKVYKTWINNLNYFSRRVSSLCNVRIIHTKINKKGYACISFSNSTLIKYLKRKEIELGLPVLSRKWDRVDLNLLTRADRFKIKYNKVKKLYTKGIKRKEICRILNINESSAKHVIRRILHGRG
jgi:hypothetical protein